MNPLDDFLKQIVEVEDEISNIVWGLQKPIRDFVPPSQQFGYGDDLTRAQQHIQDGIDRIYRAVEDIQGEAMRQQRGAA